MKAGVEHDDSKGEDVAGVRVGEDVRVELAVTLRKRLHHAVNLLRLTYTNNVIPAVFYSLPYTRRISHSS